jgi:isopentenyldiphosphate isomerase
MADITYVDDNDQVIGHGPRAEALSKGITHRIARILLFNPKGELLIQKRAPDLASPNKWDQSAAGHVDEGEDYVTAAVRELKEEVAVTGVQLKEVGKFYTDDPNGPVKRKRFNMLYTAPYDGEVKAAQDEVAELKWIAPKELEIWIHERPDDFTRSFLQGYQLYRAQK